jgi:ferredoxin
MNVITEQKPFEEIEGCLEKDKRVYLIGCGTCATMCHTGGKSEVLEMKGKLEEIGKEVTGWMVIPIACDSLVKEALQESAKVIDKAGSILVMACGFGVQTVARYSDKPVIPALNTLFLGQEDIPGHFSEVCIQCGECILAWTSGICPIATCPKGLINGPCGGAKNGKCEVDPKKDCAWALIYERLKKRGRLDNMRRIYPPRDFRASIKPGKAVLR